MERKQETTAVKRAIIAAGFDQNNVRVKHGTGTARFWIKIFADIAHAPSCHCGEPDQYGRRETCEPCKTWWRICHNRIEEVALDASGRKGLYQENVLVQIGFKEAA